MMQELTPDDVFTSDDPVLVERARDLAEIERLAEEISRRVSTSLEETIRECADEVREATLRRVFELSRFCEGDSLEVLPRETHVIVNCKRYRRSRASEEA